MKNRNKWLQLFGWLGLYVFWILVFQKREFAFSRTATIEFCYLIFIAANFYFNIYFTIPQFLYRKKYAAFIFTMLTGIIITALLRVPLATYLNKYHFLINKPQPGFSELFINSTLNISIWVVLIIAGKLIIDRFKFQQHIDNIILEKEKAELDFLNAQFNPHFLFNSLNTIYGHIDKHNTTARNMLLNFSDMLRYQLYDCNSSAIIIDKEMNYIRNYVALQQTRKEESLHVNLSIAENVCGFTISPLLFIAFIENSFKYVGNNEQKENIINISFLKEDNELTFTCYNTTEIKTNNNITHKGIGIENARRRLALLYPGKHKLVITDTEYFYEVTLKFQLS